MYNSFTDREKLATLATCAYIANIDGQIRGGEYAFFSTLTIQMNAEDLLKRSGQMPQNEALRIIKNMDQKKKDEVKRAWLKMWSFSSGGQTSGYITLGDYFPEDRLIKEMACECDIDVSGRQYIDELTF